MDSMGEWFCADDDCMQYCRVNNDGSYNFIQYVWLDLLPGEEGYPDKEYVVMMGYVNLEDYTEEDIESEIHCYYNSLEDLRKDCPKKEECNQIIAECIFENMNDRSATVTDMMTMEEATDFIKSYIGW